MYLFNEARCEIAPYRCLGNVPFLHAVKKDLHRMRFPLDVKDRRIGLKAKGLDRQ